MFHNKLNDQQQLYYNAYLRHNRKMQVMGFFGLIYSVLCALIPPLSIPYSIYYSYKSEESKKMPFVNQVASIFIIALIPIFSGIFVAFMCDALLKIRDDEFPITQVLANSEDRYLKNKNSHHAMKVQMMQSKGIAFSTLNKAEKPKRVVEYVNSGSQKNTYVYMDRAQKSRRDLMSDEKTAKTVTLEYYRDSYATSIATYNELRKIEYQRKHKATPSR